MERALKALGKSPEDVRVTASTDITRDGRFGERWLVGLDDRVLVLDPAPSQASVLVEIPYSEVDEVNADPLVGGGVLNVSSDGQKIALLHYSNTLTARFTRVARTLQAVSRNEALPEASDDELERSCPTCGRALPRYSRVCPHCLDKGKVLRRLLSYLVPYKTYVAGTMALMLIGVAGQLTGPLLTKWLVDLVLAPPEGQVLPDAQRIRWLFLLVAAMLGLRLTAYVCGTLRQQRSAWLGGRITLDVRRNLYNALQRLSLAYFDKRQTGAVMSRVTQDTNALQVFVVNSAQHFMVFVLQIVVIVFLLFGLNWKLALIALAPAPIVSVITFLFRKRLRYVYTRFWTSWSRLTAALADSLSGIRVVRAFAQESREMERFEEQSAGLFESEYTANRLVAFLFPTLSVLIELGVFPVWIFGGLMVIRGGAGDPTYGDLAAFTALLAHFYAPLQHLTNLAETVPRSLTAAERVFEVLDTEPDVADTEKAHPLPEIQGDVEFTSVTFGYDRNKPILKDVSLHVQPGEMIGLVGKTGAGKSTFINLVCRFYDPQEGTVTIDGRDLREVRLRDLRSQIGVVLQEPFLFSGTISENIAYGNPRATPEEIMRAAKAANAHDFIMKFPDGYDTQVGERGGRLSGGERQRISIARAILHNPRILIFDEATSAVDTETEKQIQEAIERLVENRTTFAIAHRLSTLRKADRIVAIDDGRIAEVGTHDELLERRGKYWRLVQMQTDLSRNSLAEA